MKVIMVMVATVNGKITRGDDPNIYSWTSKEDADYFFSLLNRHNLIVMGSKTYEAARSKIKPEKTRLRVVLTSDPKKYESETVPGAVEFSNETPEELVKRLKTKYETMLLVGGGAVNASFLKANLVSEIYLTIEPRIFGKGKGVVGEGGFEADLKLENVEKLNERGTLLLKYSVLREPRFGLTTPESVI